jgi:hypothetical protein
VDSRTRIGSEAVGCVRQDAGLVPPRALIPALALALTALPVAAVGCGGDDDGDGNEGRTTPRAQTLVYQGTTNQRQPVRFEVTNRVNGSMRLLLECRDGSDSRVTLSTGPDHPTIQNDGSFYYEETGETVASQFPGFGPGEYRGAIDGEIVGEEGSGTAAFRITFRETSCRAGVTWRVRKR